MPLLQVSRYSAAALATIPTNRCAPLSRDVVIALALSSVAVLCTRYGTDACGSPGGRIAGIEGGHQRAQKRESARKRREAAAAESAAPGFHFRSSEIALNFIFFIFSPLFVVAKLAVWNLISRCFVLVTVTRPEQLRKKTRVIHAVLFLSVNERGFLLNISVYIDTRRTPAFTGTYIR